MVSPKERPIWRTEKLSFLLKDFNNYYKLPYLKSIGEDYTRDSNMSMIVQASRSFFTVLGVRINAVQIPEVISQMESWVKEGSFGHFIIVANAHVVAECLRDPSLKHAATVADLVIPDGMPLVLLGRRRGFPLKGRAYGPDLMAAFLSHSASKNYSNFFYGGHSNTLDGLLHTIRTLWPSLQVAGVYSPPFRALTEREEKEVVDMLNEAKPDVMWVGLGCPKQERWMYEHRQSLKVPVMIGVGQAFDILAGVKHQAPAWMRNNGLEWLFRFLQEPGRLWRRYLIQGTRFVYNVLLEELGLRTFD